MHYHVLNNYDYITMYLAKVFFCDDMPGMKSIHGTRENL